jgi:hypothetical protein
MKHIAALVALCSINSSVAMAQDYHHIVTTDGVEFYWRTKLDPYATTYTAVMRLVNTTASKKEVTVKPTFTCSDGTEKEDSGQSDTLRPFQTKSGEMSGWWFKPCPENTRITRIHIETKVRSLQ